MDGCVDKAETALMRDILMREIVARGLQAAATTWDAFRSRFRTIWRSTLDLWFREYLRQYERVGIADIISRELTRYRWDDAARDYSPESPIWMAVYRRRD